MGEFRVEIDFMVRGNDAAEAARSAFQIMQQDRTLRIKIAEILSKSIQKPSVTISKEDLPEWQQGEALKPTQGNSVFSISSAFEVEGDDITSAAWAAFRAMAWGPEMRIGVSEHVSGAVYKPSSLFTLADAYEGMHEDAGPRP